MPGLLRTTLFSTALSFTLGCSFFSIEDADRPLVPKKTPGSAGAKGAGGTGQGGMSGSAGETGTGGSIATNGGTGGGGTGGSGGSGVGGDASVAGSGASAGSGTMAGAGGTSGGMPSLGGMGGDAMPTAGSGMTAGASSGGSGGLDATACMTLSSDAKLYGGHCYLLVTNAVNFDAAKMDCMSKQSHLVTISNGDPASKDTFDAEDMFVYGLAGGKDTWLGLADGKMDRDPGDGTPYVWIDGEPNPPADWGMAYGWVSGEPNNYQKPCMNGDTCYEHCGFMVADQGDKWNDDLCEATKQYVCEWDMLPPAPSPQ